MDELVLSFYVLVSISTIWLGFRVYERWVNHISLYGVVWGVQIILFELRFINYPDLSVETVLFIFGAWAIFIISSLTIRKFYSAGAVSQHGSVYRYNDNVIFALLIVLTFIGAAGTYQHWTKLIQLFGSVQNAIISGNLVYSITRTGGIPGAWPYVDSVSLAASLLGGYYVGSRGKYAFVGIIPFITELMEAVYAAGRANFIIAAVLWGTAFFLSQAKRKSTNRRALRRQLVFLTSIIAIFVFGMEFVRSFRGVKESFTGESQSLSRINTVGFITPSIYLYLSSDVAVLNKFLNYDFEGKGENQIAGANTLSPIYRVLSKFDLTTYPPQSQKFYTVPVGTNTGTYLRELYADWGVGGTLLIVYILGVLCSVTFEAYQRTKSLTLLAVLAHLYVLVFYTFAVQLTRLSPWIVSLIFAVIAGVIANATVKRNDTAGEPTT